MMIQFDISALAVTLTEGGVYSFTVTPKAALSEKMDVRWVIVPKGKIPITNNDFSALEGTRDFAAGDTTAQTITITPTDDDRPEVSGEFAIQIYQVVPGGDNILLASQDVTLTDDDGSSDASTTILSGNSNTNNFFFGGSNPLDSEGVSGNDTYVISRYQTGDVDLRDLFGTNIIKFDYGVEISSARKLGFFGVGDGELLLGADYSSPTATVTWAAPANWKYQIGDSDVLLSWADFLEELGLSGDGGTLSTPYRVASLASDSETEGNVALQLSGGEADEVFAFGNDGRLDGVGGAGDDIYIITRYQSDDVELTDDFGTNIIKLDFGVEISSATKIGSGFGAGEGKSEGKLLLGTDASVTWANPADWQYQIGDDVVLDWEEFLTKLGLIDIGDSENIEDTGDSEAIDDSGGELVNHYTVGFLPDITTNGGDTLMVRVKDGETYVKTIVAIDGDGDDLTFSLSDSGDADDFEIDASGELRFRDKPEEEKYTLMVRVTDGSYAVDGRPPADGAADADTLFFKYSGGELSKTGDLVSVASGKITKANGATFNFAAQTGLDVEGEVDSYIIVDDVDSDGTYEARRVEEFPTGDDYYALGYVVREDDKPTTYEPYYNDMINVEVSIDVV